LSCQPDNLTSSCLDSPSGCCPDGKTEDVLGACNSTSENTTALELSSNSNNSNLQSAYNDSDETALLTPHTSDSNSSYPADLDLGATLTTADQELSSGDVKDDDNMTSDLTVSRHDDRNLLTSDLSHDASVNTLSGLIPGENVQLTPPSVHLSGEQVDPCSAAPYGCCPDGITVAAGPGKAGCIVATPTPRLKPGRAEFFLHLRI